MEAVKKIERNMNEDHPTCVIEEYYKERNEKRRKNDPSWKYFSGNFNNNVSLVICFQI